MGIREKAGGKIKEVEVMTKTRETVREEEGTRRETNIFKCFQSGLFHKTNCLDV